MHKSTVHRLLATLEAKRFVKRDPDTALYTLGNRLVQLAFLSLQSTDLREIAAPYMKKLNEMHRETITLSIMDDADVVYVAVLESPQTVKLAAKPGQRLPALSTASGKVLLAYSNEDIVQKIYKKGVPHYTSFTIHDTKTMDHILVLARERGFAYSEQEYEEGINAVAAPILDKNQRPIAALAVAGPSYRLSVERMLEIGPSIASVTKELSKELGIISKMR